MNTSVHIVPFFLNTTHHLYILMPLLCRVKTLLGRCVCVAARPAEAFSKCLLLYSLTTSLASSWADDEDRGFSDIMYGVI